LENQFRNFSLRLYIRRMTKNFGSKSSKKFHCEFCDYITTRKSQYDRHNLTLKHISTKNTTNISSEKCSFIEKVPHDFLCHCGKKYKHQSSLWNHRQKCVYEKEEEKNEEKEEEKKKEKNKKKKKKKKKK